MVLALEEIDEEILEYNSNAMDHNMKLNYNELFELYIEFEEHVSHTNIYVGKERIVCTTIQIYKNKQ